MKRVAPCFLLLLVSAAAFAHGDKPHNADELWAAWSFDPLVVVLLLASATVYTIGVYKLWHESSTGSAISVRGAFLSAWLAVACHRTRLTDTQLGRSAVFRPHDTARDPDACVGSADRARTAAHRGDVGDAASVATQGRSAVRNDAISSTWEFFTGPTVAFIVHGLALWIWHIPFLFQATLESDLVHTLQHASFLGSALLFWWAIIYGKRGVASYGAGVLYLFITSIHSGILGAFLTFTKRLWYPIYAPTAAGWGLSPLEDQQLGGLIMWVPAGIVYIVAALFMFAAWINASERIAVRNKARRATPAAAGA